MSNTDILRLAGVALYGSRWQSALAHELNIAPRMVRHWVSGQRVPPAGVWDDIRAALEKRHADIERALDVFAQPA